MNTFLIESSDIREKRTVLILNIICERYTSPLKVKYFIWNISKEMNEVNNHISFSWRIQLKFIWMFLHSTYSNTGIRITMCSTSVFTTFHYIFLIILLAPCLMSRCTSVGIFLSRDNFDVSKNKRYQALRKSLYISHGFKCTVHRIVANFLKAW